MKNKVAIVVLSHNNLEVSKTFLSYLKKNTDRSFYKLIWIDNNSSDETPFWLKDQDIDFLSLETENTGVIGGRNTGFRVFLENEAFKDCNFICFLDNDQYVQEGWLESHFELIEQGFDLVGVEAWKLNANFLPIGKIAKPGESFSYIGCGGSMIRRNVVELIGVYDEHFNPAYFEDPDYSFRCIEKGFKLACNHQNKIHHVGHQTLGFNKNKAQIFVNSLKYFRSKWRGKNIPMQK